MRRGLAAPCSGRGNCPPKAVSEPPASVKCKPFHFVSTRKYPLFSMYHDPGIHPKIYLPFECTSFQPSAVRQLLISSAESELSFRSQLCPGKWQEDSVIFSLLPLMSAVTSYYLVRLLSYLPQFNADRNQEDELEGKTMQLRYNISRRGKMHASCGNILYRIIGGRHEGSSRTTIASNSL